MRFSSIFLTVLCLSTFSHLATAYTASVQGQAGPLNAQGTITCAELSTMGGVSCGSNGTVAQDGGSLGALESSFFASADAETGELKISGSTGTTGSGGVSIASARIDETFSVEFDEGVNEGTITGVIFAEGTFSNVPQLNLTIGVQGVQETWRSSNGTLALPETYRNTQIVQKNSVGPTFVSLIFALDAQAIFAMGAVYDLSNTAFIGLEVSDGLTVTPSDPGFLSAAAPVPVPAGLVMFFPALAFLWRFKRHNIRASVFSQALR